MNSSDLAESDLGPTRVTMYNGITFQVAPTTPLEFLGRFIYRIQLADLPVVSTAEDKITVLMPDHKGCGVDDLMRIIHTREYFLRQKGITIQK